MNPYLEVFVVTLEASIRSAGGKGKRENIG